MPHTLLKPMLLDLLNTIQITQHTDLASLREEQADQIETVNEQDI